MIYSRKYSRNFIPLKQDNASYNLDFRPAIGKCLIEIKDGKGKVTVYAQGIKPNVEYNAELMCFEKGSLKNATIGTLSVDETGKGEIKADFNPENVLNTGNKIEDFNIVALVVSGLDKVVSSLVGYVGNEVSWKNKYVIIKNTFSNNIQNNNNNDNSNNNSGNNEMPQSPATNPHNNNNETPQTPTTQKPNLMPYPSDSNDDFEIPPKPTKPQRPISRPLPSQPDCDCNIPQNPTIQKPEGSNPNLSELEQGLIDKEQGLIEREKGLFDREQGLLQKEENPNTPIDLADLEKALWEKERGLLEKEQGLFDKEQGLLAKENALNQGFLPTDADMALRGKELKLIEWEKQLINQEEKFIQREQNIINNLNPASSDLERGLREKQKGLLEREKGLLEREKGLISKEEGLFEKEQGIRDRNSGIKERENTLNPNRNNNSNFKEMLDRLKNGTYNSESKSEENNINTDNIYSENITSENLDIDYIKFKNMPLNPFKNQYENISWFRIAPYELSAFGKETQKYAKNPFVYSCYKKYNHLMLGIKNENGLESYILGVPCQYKNNFSVKGLENFVPLNENVSTNSIKNGEYGYRLFNI